MNCKKFRKFEKRDVYVIPMDLMHINEDNSEIFTTRIVIVENDEKGRELLEGLHKLFEEYEGTELIDFLRDHGCVDGDDEHWFNDARINVVFYVDEEGAFYMPDWSDTDEISE